MPSDGDVIRALKALPFRPRGYTPYQVSKWLRTVDGATDTTDLAMWEDHMELMVQGGALVNVAPRGYENARVGHYLLSPDIGDYTDKQRGRIEDRLAMISADATRREEIKHQRLNALREYMRRKKEREAARRADGKLSLTEIGWDEMIAELEDEPLHVVVLDTETTGLTDGDDIIQLAAVNGYGRTVIDSYYRPWKDSWPEAEAVNGITPEAVSGCGHIESDMARIAGTLRQAHVVVCYNVPFDMGYLAAAGLRGRYRTFDAMEAFAEVYGERAEWLPPGDDGLPPYKWQKLTTAARHYGLTWDGKAHGARADADMTLRVLKAMARERMDTDNPLAVRL